MAGLSPPPPLPKLPPPEIDAETYARIEAACCRETGLFEDVWREHVDGVARIVAQARKRQARR